MRLRIVWVLIICCIQYRLYIYMPVLGLKYRLVRALNFTLLLRIESLRLVYLPPELGLAALTLPLPIEMQFGAVERTVLILRGRVSLAQIAFVPLKLRVLRKLGDFIFDLGVDFLHLYPWETVLLEKLTLAAKIHLVIVSEKRGMVKSTLYREVVWWWFPLWLVAWMVVPCQHIRNLLMVVSVSTLTFLITNRCYLLNWGYVIILRIQAIVVAFVKDQ